MISLSQCLHDVFLFDTETSQMITQPVVPKLQKGRISHSSCSTEQYAFVFGGTDAYPIMNVLNSLEYLVLHEVFNNSSENSRWNIL